MPLPLFHRLGEVTQVACAVLDREPVACRQIAQRPRDATRVGFATDDLELARPDRVQRHEPDPVGPRGGDATEQHIQLRDVGIAEHRDDRGP